jgi:signal peptidase II
MKARFFLLAAAGGLVLDQATKALAFSLIAERPEGLKGPAIIPGFLNLTLKRNPGISWGILGSVPPELLVAGNVVIIALLVYFYLVARKGKPDRRLDLAVAAIIAGAAGNVVDRTIWGHVLDFIDVYIPVVGYDYPVFNVADILIVLGLVAYLALSWKKERAGQGAPAKAGQGRQGGGR